MSVTLASVVVAELEPVKEFPEVVFKDNVLALRNPVVFPPSKEGLVTEFI